MTRKWVTYDAIDYISVKFHGAVGDGVADDTAAIQAAFDEACGAGNPVTTTRTANRRVLFPQGVYLVTAPLTVKSVIGLQVEAKGYVEIRAGANMAAVFDINGAAYSRFGGFTITGGTGIQVDDAFYTYFESSEANRTNTRNSYHDIVIRNLDFITGIRVGKLSEGSQVDNDEWRNISVTGAWSSAVSGVSATRYQHGIYFGDSVNANNLLHHCHHLTLTANRYNIRVDATNIAVYGAGFANAEIDLNLTPRGFCHFSGIRSENSQRLLSRGATSAAQNITLSDVIWNGSSINADGKWIKFSGGGVLRLAQIRCDSPAVAPIVESGSGSTPNLVLVDGMTITGTGDPYSAAASFLVNAGSRARVRGFVTAASSGATTSITDYDSSGASVKADVYTSGTSTWTKPANAVRVRIACLGAGGGGGSGRRGAAGTVRCGGGGGGGGAWSEVEYDAADLPSQLSVTVGSAGAGGAAITANDTNGNNGGAGNPTFVRDTGLTIIYCRANGGGAGGGGTNAAGTGGGAASGLFGSGAGGAASTTGLVGVAGTSASAAGGGGSGGGITTGDAASAGGAAGLSNTRASSNAPGGGAIDTNGQSSNGAPTPAGATFPGHGGGGGGSSITTTAGSGGAGADAGGGGGGGGASLNGNNSGAGGAGAVGRIVITSYGT